MAFTAYHLPLSGRNWAMIEMKTRLKTHGWTVPDSGDGRVDNSPYIPGNYGNGTDILTSGAFDVTEFASGNIGNPLAWFRLRSPLGAGGPEIIISRGTSGWGAHQFSAWLCVNAGAGLYPGAGADFVGTPPDLWGRAYQRPRALDDITRQGQIFGPTGGDGSGILDLYIGDVDEGYAFFAIWRDPTTHSASGLFFDCLTDGEPTDESPYTLYITGDTPIGQRSRLYDGRPVASGPEGGDWGPNPSAMMGAYLSKTDDLDPLGEYRWRLASYHLPVPATGTRLTGDDVNPYATEYDLLLGAGFVHCHSPESFVSWAGRPGLFKGRSRIFRAQGGATAPGGATNAARTLYHLDEGLWLAWDGVTEASGDVVTREHAYWDDMELTQIENEIPSAIEVPMDDVEWTTLTKELVVQDVTLPEVGEVSPAPGTPITTGTPLEVTVTDDSGAFRRVILAVSFTSGDLAGIEEVAFDGDAFVGYYSGSARTPLAGGFRFSVVRDGGWPASPTLRVFAFDRAGNEV